MGLHEEDDAALRATAIRNVASILEARQRAEDEARRAVSRLRATLEATTDAILVVDNDGTLSEYNERFLTLWQLDRTRLADLGFSDLVALLAKQLKDPALLRSPLRADIEQPTSVRGILEGIDGRTIECTATVQLADGRSTGRVWSFRDITTQQQQLMSRSRLAAVVDTSDDAIISKTLQGIIRTWNRSAERMFGYTAAEAIGKPVTMLIPKELQAEETSILARLVAGEQIDHFETTRVRKDGTTFSVSLSVSPVRDDYGRIVGAAKIARDITARRESELAIAEQARVLNLLNEAGKAIAVGLELEAIIQTVTDAATTLSGAEFGAFSHNTGSDEAPEFGLFTMSQASTAAFEKFRNLRGTPLFAPRFEGRAPIRIDDVQRDPRFAETARSEGDAGLAIRSYLAVPVVSRSTDLVGGLIFGHSKPNMFTPQAEYLVSGIAAHAAVAIDNARLYERVRRAADERQLLLEAERAARSELEHVSTLKDEFLATLSHELRTPLSAILGWAQVLRVRNQNNPETLEGLSVIERNAKVQAQLIEDLLDVSRIISGKVRLDVRRVDLQDVVKAAVETVRHAAEAKDVRLHVVLDPRAGPVHGDPDRLQQCIWNLVSNAIKFTPKGGQVHVGLARVNSHVEVSVVDSGIGIAAEFLPHVFERFRQADASTTRRFGGLGLGLSIVKSLIELHGGEIRVASEGKNKGAAFTIQLPLMVVDTGSSKTSRTPQAASATDHPSLAGITVLVVDDEPDARTLIKRILEDCGASVRVASCASEALAMLKLGRPHVLISDIGMPGEDGYQLIRKVRELPGESGGRTPAAALSAFARAEDRTRALRAGYQTHLAKPVEATELTAVVASLAGH